MKSRGSELMFNVIAPIYGLFFNLQRKKYAEVLEDLESELDLKSFKTVLDVGCGTGALCSVLSEKGLKVTGIDPAEKMLNIAMKQPENQAVQFLEANALERLPFDDKSFDVSIASYVAHGLQPHERKKMYAEMSRVSVSKVIIYDYNQNRSALISFVEWLERGDYFRFIRKARREMEDCVFELKDCFSEVKVINVDVQAALYICIPN